MRRPLREEIRAFIAIQRYFGYRWAVLPGIRWGFLSWLDGFKILERKRPCGCRDLGGGGRALCSDFTVEHLLEK